MEGYQYHVFFEVKDLTDKAFKHIQKYFSLQRRSGGGDCEVSKAGKDIYKISFLNVKARDNVLRKKDHNISVPEEGNIYVSVRSENIAERSEQPKDSDAQDQETATGKSVEKVYKLDQYLLRYLSESEKPKKDFKKCCSGLFCSFKICTESEKLVVTRDPEAKDSCSLDKWEIGVDQLVDALKYRYNVHFEVERDKSAIIEDNAFLQNDFLKIYSDEGTDLAVVVGERKEVNKILKLISGFQEKDQVQKECHITEDQYALIKEQFEFYVTSNSPNLKILKDQGDVVLLKGVEKDVSDGENELSKLVHAIQKKKIPLDPVIVSFLKSSDIIKHFQKRFQKSLRSPVMLETSGSDLVLLCVSDGPLEEAATAVQRDLCEETVHLESAQKYDAFCKLKQDLSDALSQVNAQGVQAEIKYQDESSSDPKVQLVGFTTEVRKLKKIIFEYKRNHQRHQDSLPLRCLEMAENFPEILSMAGLKRNSVEIKPICSPFPCVHLTGPLCEVQAVKDVLGSFLQSLVMKRFEVKGPGVWQFFQQNGAETLKLVKGSFNVAILPINEGPRRDRVPEYHSFLSCPSNQAQASPVYENLIRIKVVIGSLEEQQVDAMIAPMVNTNLTSTLIGKSLLKKGGQQLQKNFDTAKIQRSLALGDVLKVDATPALGCSKVFFIEFEPKGKMHESDKSLTSVLGRAFFQCELNSCGAVALPVIGPGIVLSMPVEESVDMLTKAICRFLSRPTDSLHTFCIPIMPNYPHSEQMFQRVMANLSEEMVDKNGHALFSSLTSDLDEVTIPVGKIELHLVFGDITNETTDAIVNTTDFTDFQTNGVCKDILTKAGPRVQAQLTGAKVASGKIFTTPPGNFPCKTIIHVCGNRSPDVIKTLAKAIITHCEHAHYQSVAIPAICAGQGALEPNVVAKSILEGVKDTIQGGNLQYLQIIRFILMKINVFLEFKTMAEQIFGANSQLTAPAPLIPTSGHSSPSTRARAVSLPALPDLSSLFSSVPVVEEKAAFLVMGDSDKDVCDACQELQRAFDGQCSTQSFCSDDIKRLTDTEMNMFLSHVDSFHLKLEDSSPGGLVVRGRKDGVNEVAKVMQDSLRRQVREKDEAALYSQVAWCIRGDRGVWQKVSKEVNMKLETADVDDGIVDAQGVKWTVDLNRNEAKASDSGRVTALKRLENHLDFRPPIYWDNMSQNDSVNVIALDPQSTEYQTVKADFKKTAPKTVLKIERIQNPKLRQMYEVRKADLEVKNTLVGAAEKLLYHGTSETSCSSIINSNFNRNYSGQNGTAYGQGTYFAVNASYSASTAFAVPLSDGTQQMFVARVLTGYFSQGQGGMRTPPVRVQPDILYDSVVDNIANPTMYVVFHDCQAYPDYLITFQ
ncbi:hypothetical protein DNTS_012030 [Danionella cerebrum]|uniref:Poly [ADP-ribose] polymerase n=1 Tax=Danionella cerebrum TaxID=2873325 RepID=A0A553MX55_9TELE|nr:hypothetical protein DNTS_012030 [Danionella translucida]TRY57759.1 hypothetical protein DNTS_012030 [Danionella translucida]